MQPQVKVERALDSAESKIEDEDWTIALTSLRDAREALPAGTAKEEHRQRFGDVMAAMLDHQRPQIERAINQGLSPFETHAFSRM